MGNVHFQFLAHFKFSSTTLHIEADIRFVIDVCFDDCYYWWWLLNLCTKHDVLVYRKRLIASDNSSGLLTQWRSYITFWNQSI